MSSNKGSGHILPQGASWAVVLFEDEASMR